MRKGSPDTTSYKNHTPQITTRPKTHQKNLERPDTQKYETRHYLPSGYVRNNAVGCYAVLRCNTSDYSSASVIFPINLLLDIVFNKYC